MRTNVKVRVIDKKFYLLLLATLIIILGLFAAQLKAMPPHPDIQAKIDAGEVQKPFVSTAMKAAPMGAMFNTASKLNMAKITGPFKVLCILVDFSDHTSQTNAEFFDTLIYENQNGTVQDYYDEISYGQIDIVSVSLPSALGWERAPSPYTYYVNNNQGTGAWPNNSQKLCEDLVDAVDPVVDFSDYDNDGDGYVDVIMIVHSGPGAEFTGNTTDIWSHKWGISPRSKDGTYISAYTIMPEFWSSSGDMTIGVFCHELGHGFGLPDLYDTDNSSSGIGRYSLMAAGSWNGSLGSSPAHPDAWSRLQLGWASPTTVASNQTNISIANVEGGGPIYRLWTNGSSGNEYFLVENRQKIGYDAGLPGSGLCIWHIDDGVGDNEDEWYPGYTTNGHYKVALEQADNLFSMEKNTSNGEAGDFFPGSTNNTEFTPSTSPNSNCYDGSSSLVAISSISSSASTMTADFAVSLAAANDDEDDLGQLPNIVVLDQNFPNPFNPSTTIRYSLPSAEQVDITVYNILGEQVIQLYSGYRPAGSYEAVWDGSTTDGQSSPSGIYFYELATDESKDVRKMLLMK
ncbi:MAG: M6 family metalloprotease domain-containing protein [candidate division Zixibacteria bacterium]|nr:M6 family metalloprotease domain-containing protein [candidate division Zixibacteria bacterium]